MRTHGCVVKSPIAALALALACGYSSGCRFVNSPPGDQLPVSVAPPALPPGQLAPMLPPVQQVPLEKSKVSLPTYRVEPPDILLIDAVKIVPKAPYRISAQDQLQVNAAGTLAQQPIGGIIAVEPGGSIDLGPGYGRVPVAGLSIDEATQAVASQLSHFLRNPQVSITLAQSAGQQQIAGEHIVAQDGRINLGIYGSVYVAGMTVDEVRHAVEQHLTQYLDSPKVAVDVGAFNSKVYYVITAGAGFGESVARFPATGNETVLDALSQINGLSQLASKHAIWIARPTVSGAGCDQILPVHWDEITKQANTSTNYQVFPGDRIFIDSDKFYAADSALSKVIAPFERIIGVTTLGFQTLFRVEHPRSAFGNGGGSSSGF
jgi:polysaccharide biosynthesis/export protein